MFTTRTFVRLGSIVLFVVSFAMAQDVRPTTTPTDTFRKTPLASGQHITFDEFVDAVIGQEHNLVDFARTFKPMIETYIQEEGSEFRFQKGVAPNGDDYFLSRLDLTGDSPLVVPFADEETWNKGGEKYFVHDPQPFSQAAFAQALFPDFGHFERQNYSFEFVRWEALGALRCAVMDVTPHGNSKKRGFVGRIWAEDKDHAIVRFTGTFTSKGRAKRAYHFDSWRLNTQANRWMPAYVYTEEYEPYDPSHKLWFKAQTRVWGYDLRNVTDIQESTRQAYPSNAASDETVFAPENVIVRRLQGAGLMAPDGDVNRIPETVVNNILITNNLENLIGVRCRVLLTTPLESFVVGRTIVLSRGLLDVLPDESTLAAVLAHELAHIVLSHEVTSEYLTSFALPFPDSLIPSAIDFHFTRTQEAEADKKATELFSKSPYKDQFVTGGLFLRALEANAGRFPILLHGPFSHDFGSSHLSRTQTRYSSIRSPKADRLDKISALPIGSRIVVDPWSGRIEMTRSKPVPLLSRAEKIPFEVTPFYPYLKRQEATETLQGRAQQ